MFIKNLIYNYNAQELLLTASILAFALDAWVTLILIMELTIVLLLAGKKMQQKIFQPIVLGLHDYCRNPSLGSRPRQGGCKVAGL
jgi:hypothetical protein